MNDMIINDQDLVDNPTPRVAVCLVLDTSGSMTGQPINELNDGVELFFDAVKGDETAARSAEVAIVTFGDSANVVLDFAGIDKQTVPQFSALGSTPMGEAVNLALNILEKRKKEYSNAGIDYYQPWMVLMTDGEPTDSIDSAVTKTCSLISNRKLTIFPIGIGASADMKVLARFSPKRAPMRLKGLNFKEFFEWLSKSVSNRANSSPNETAKADDDILSWVDLG